MGFWLWSESHPADYLPLRPFRRKSPAFPLWTPIPIFVAFLFLWWYFVLDRAGELLQSDRTAAAEGLGLADLGETAELRMHLHDGSLQS